ncbi:hypothetical protein ACIRQP_35510 [Streptomyces sp. NPDC102274]|uniref:hypothetical protein n=1 Tax=Streptomyces sp. NPDC102274 TaxID=3366151 RepID=UPI003813D972
MSAASFIPKGPFSLASSIRFLEGFTPASYDHATDGVLRVAFPADDGRSVIGCMVSRKEAADTPPATVSAEFTVHRDGKAVPTTAGTPTHKATRAQIARILSLDVEGTGFPALADADPVVAGLQADYPDLRPVGFYSPYEAAAWTVIGNRVRMTRAAAIKARLARDHGQAIDVAGQQLHAFPTPEALCGIDHIDGRLHAVAGRVADIKRQVQVTPGPRCSSSEGWADM